MSRIRRPVLTLVLGSLAVVCGGAGALMFALGMTVDDGWPVVLVVVGPVLLIAALFAAFDDGDSGDDSSDASSGAAFMTQQLDQLD